MMITEYKCGCIIVTTTQFRKIDPRYKIKIPIGDNIKIKFTCKKHKKALMKGYNIGIKTPWNVWEGTPHHTYGKKGFQCLIEGVPQGRSIW